MVNTGLKNREGAQLKEEGKIENPYLNAHLHINMNSRLMSRKSFKRPKRCSDNELFLMRTSKGYNPAIRGQIKKR